MAGLLLTVDNTPTNTYVAYNGVANVVVKAEKASGDWAGYDTATIMWSVYGPSQPTIPALTPQDANDLTLPHSFTPVRSGRYLVRASARATGVDADGLPHPFTHFTALYEVGSSTGMSTPAAKESLEYDPLLGWARSIESKLDIISKAGAIGGRFLYVQNVHPNVSILAGTVCALAAVPHPDSGSLAAPIWSDPHAAGTWKGGKGGLVAWNNPYTHDTDSLQHPQELITQVVPVSHADAFVTYVPLFVAQNAIAAGARGPVIMRGFVPASLGGNFGDAIYVGAQGALTNAKVGSYVRKVGVVGSGNARTINPDGAASPPTTTGFVWFDGDARISESVTYSNAQDNTVAVYDISSHSVSWKTHDEIGIQQTGAAANYLPKWSDVTGLALENSAIISDASGNVGVGSSAPSARMEVVDMAADIAIVKIVGADGTITAQAGNKFTFSRDSVNYLTCTDPLGSLRFETGGGGNSRIAISAGGNVGIGTTAPQAKLHVDGSIINKVRVVTATDNVLTTDYIIAVDNPNFGSAVDVYLPAATADIVGMTFKIKDASGTANTGPINVTKDSSTTDTIDGTNPYSINSVHGSIEVVCLEAGKWLVL